MIGNDHHDQPSQLLSSEGRALECARVMSNLSKVQPGDLVLGLTPGLVYLFIPLRQATLTAWEVLALGWWVENRALGEGWRFIPGGIISSYNFSAFEKNGLEVIGPETSCPLGSPPW